ncbi:MAG: ABC transporter permease [Candidatus Methanomethylicia archaeon]
MNFKIQCIIKGALFVILTFSFLFSQIDCSLSSNPNFTISGYVFKFEDSHALSDAIVIVYHEYYSWSEFLGSVKTNENGFYQLNINKYLSGGFIKIFVFHIDYNSGFPDRVPVCTSIPINPLSTIESLNLNFSMLPAAVLVFSGGFMHVNYSDPASRVMYQVEVKDLPQDLNCLLKYDFKDLSNVYSMLGLKGNVIPVPAGYKINVIITGVFQETMSIPSTIIFGRTTYTTTPSIRESYLSVKLFDDFEVLSSNDIMYFTIYDVSLSDSLRIVKSMYNSVLNKLDIARMNGFYTTSLFSQLDRINRMINEAEDYLERDNPSASFATLRSCCVLLKSLSSTIDGMYMEASLSINLLLIFFIFGSVSIGYFISERLIFKIIVSIVSYASLLYILSISYPLFPKFDINLLPKIFSPLILIAGLEILSRGFIGFRFIVDSAELFSVSKRNLKRRKLRTILILISLIVFTAGSLALTSFSLEVDLLTYYRRNDYGVDGLSIEIRVPDHYVVSGFSPREAENNPYAQNLPSSVLDMIELLGQVEYKTFRAESKARVTPYTRFSENTPIMGIVSFSDSSDPVAKLVSSTFITGGLPSKSGEIAISISLASKLGFKVGDLIPIPVGNPFRFFKICGLFDDNAIYNLRELSGRHVLPYKMILSMKGEDGVPNVYESRICEPSETVFIHWSDISSFELSVSRVYVYYKLNTDIYSIGKTIALRGGNILSTVLIGDECINMILAEYLSSSGFEAFIPMILIILNATISAIASLREREYESIVITSLGASPSQLFRIFINESIIMGFSAGSIGYAFGIFLYKVMSIFSRIAVFPKISFLWVFFSIILSLIALVIGSSIVFRSALIVVPSKLWNIKRNIQYTPEGRIDIYEVPLKLDPKYIGEFLSYVFNKIKSYPTSIEESIRVVDKRVDKVSGRDIHKLTFTYDIGSGTASKNTSRNILEIYVDDNGECKILLYVKSIGSSSEKLSMMVAKFIRHIAMEWSSSYK